MFYKKKRTTTTETPKDPSLFDFIKVYVPKGTGNIIKQLSLSKQIPVSRLVAIAIDHELDQTEPFRYDCDIPETPYIRDAYIPEATKILDYLKKFTSGTQIDTLLLCRRDIGIPDKDLFMHAYRELLGVELIEEFVPEPGARNQNMRVRVMFHVPDHMKRRRFIAPPEES